MRKRNLERQLGGLDRHVLAGPETYCEIVGKRLEGLVFQDNQELPRLVVDWVVVEDGKVRVEAIVPLDDGFSDMGGLRPQRRKRMHTMTRWCLA